MWRILVALALMCGVASAQPVVSGGWRPPVGCSTNQVIQFNGTAWVCGTISTFSTNNIIPKGNGTTLVASAIVDVSGQIGIGSGAASPIGAVDLYNTLAGQTTAALTDAGSRTSLLFLHDGGGAVGAGGGIVFGNATSRTANAVGWAAIKGLIQNGSGNTTGDLAFSTRNATSDTNLTERMRIAANGNVSIQQALAVNGNATLGDSTSADSHTLNGATALASSNSNTITASYTGTSQTTDRLTLHVTNSGTYDATAAQRIAYGVNSQLTATRSAGSNNLINIAIFGSATGSQDDRALQTNAGNVLFNQVSGNTAIGTSANASIRLNVGSSQHGITSISNPAASTSGKIAMQAITTGTYDLTGGSTTALGIDAQAVGTRSAGATNLVNVGVRTTASGGQVNTALQTIDGNVYLNTTSGNTGVGYVHGATIPAKLSVSGGTSTAVASSAGTLLELQQADATNAYITIRSTAQGGIRFNNLSGTGDGFVIYDNTRHMNFGTSGIVRMATLSSGSLLVGDTSGTAVDSDVDVITVGNSGTGQTVSGKALLSASHTGSYSTAGGSVTYYGANISVSATESAGGNTLTGVALRLSATNGDDPIGLWVAGGRTQIDGNVIVGSAATNSITVNATTQRGLRNNLADTYYEWNDDWFATLSQSGSGGTNTALVGGEMEYLSVVTGSSTTSATISSLSALDHPGVVRFDTGSVTNANISRSTDRTALLFRAGGVQTYEALVRFPVLSSSTDGYQAIVGFYDNLSVNQGDGCWFLYDERNVATGGSNTTNAQKLSCWCGASSTLGKTKFMMDGTTVSEGSFTTVNAPVSAGTWLKLKVVVTGTSTAEFYVNGTKSCHITSNIPSNTASDFFGAGWMLIKSSGSAAVQMDTDFTGYSMQLGAAR